MGALIGSGRYKSIRMSSSLTSLRPIVVYFHIHPSFGHDDLDDPTWWMDEHRVKMHCCMWPLYVRQTPVVILHYGKDCYVLLSLPHPQLLLLYLVGYKWNPPLILWLWCGMLPSSLAVFTVSVAIFPFHLTKKDALNFSFLSTRQHCALYQEIFAVKIFL